MLRQVKQGKRAEGVYVGDVLPLDWSGETPLGQELGVGLRQGGRKSWR